GRGNAVRYDFFTRRELPAERRDLDDLLAKFDVGKPKAAADDPAVSEELLDLGRVRGRADVEILRTASEEKIAHAAADEIRDVLGLTQPVQDFERIRVDVATRDRVVRARHDSRHDA